MEETSTHTFTGDRAQLEQWLSRCSDYRIADVSFGDSSVLLYRDAAPFTVQGWSSAALGQTLRPGAFPCAGDVDSVGAADALALLLDRGAILDALLLDADFARERSDPQTRSDLLKQASSVSEEQNGAARAFASLIAYDTGVGTAFQVPGLDALAERADGVDGVPDAVLETLAEAAGQTTTGMELADLLVEAARPALPDPGTDDAGGERSALGNRLRREVLPQVLSRVLIDVPDGVRNEALRRVASTRRLE